MLRKQPSSASTFDQEALSHVRNLSIFRHYIPKDIAARCTNLTALEVYHYIPDIFELIPPNITIFNATIDQYNENDMKRLVSRCPNITSLTICANSTRALELIEHPLEKLQLREFKITSNIGGTRINFPLFATLGFKSGASLRSLSCCGVELTTRSLGISDVGGPSTGGNSCSLPNLEAVHFSNVSFDGEVFSALLAGTNRIKKLELQVVENLAPIDLCHVITRNASTLTLLDCFHIINAPVFELELPNLSSLRCRSFDSLHGKLETFIKKRGAQLESLVLFGPRSNINPIVYPNETRMWIDTDLIASHCIRLKRLLLYNLPLRISQFENILVGCKVLQFVFAKLDQSTLSSDRTSVPEEVYTIAKARADASNVLVRITTSGLTIPTEDIVPTRQMVKVISNGLVDWAF
ncbi:hypothetical protein SeLEV6574_g01105 [Synchytrium endobioticum]|nr:hypothetical protein SeLEV6574_g01105 [Synchytrium endobioticum]